MGLSSEDPFNELLGRTLAYKLDKLVFEDEAMEFFKTRQVPAVS